MFLFSCSKQTNHQDYNKNYYNDTNQTNDTNEASQGRQSNLYSDNINFESEIKKLVTTIFQDIFPHKKNVNTARLLRSVNSSGNSDELHDNLRRLFDAHKDYHTLYFDENKPTKYGFLSSNLQISSVTDDKKELFVISDINFTNKHDVNTVLKQFQLGDVIVSVNNESPQWRIASILENNLGANKAAKKSKALESFFESEVPMGYCVVVFRDGQYFSVDIPSYIPSEISFIYSFLFKNIQGRNCDFHVNVDVNDVDVNDVDVNDVDVNDVDVNDVDVNDGIYQINSFDDFAYVKLKKISYKHSDDYYESLKDIVKNFRSDILSQNKNKLIIDVRNNGGGYIELADILAYLFYDPKINKPFFPMHYRLKASRRNLDEVLKFQEKMNRNQIHLKYIILIKK